MSAAVCNRFIQESIAGGLQEIPVDDSRACLSLSEFTVTAGTQKMVLQGPLLRISLRQSNRKG